MAHATSSVIAASSWSQPLNCCPSPVCHSLHNMLRPNSSHLKSPITANVPRLMLSIITCACEAGRAAEEAGGRHARGRATQRCLIHGALLSPRQQGTSGLFSLPNEPECR